MKRITKFVLAVALCACCVGVLSCNTTKGVGADIEKAGAGLKHSAERNGAN